MNILQISALDEGGGAANVPRDLFLAYRALGHRSMMCVGHRWDSKVTDPDIYELPNDLFRSRWCKRMDRFFELVAPARAGRLPWLRHLRMAVGQPHRAWNRLRGLEDFDFPASKRLLEFAPAVPDIIHCHNLHGGYFDLAALAGLSRTVPMIVTLHDMWLFTGHCGYSIDCTRWAGGCGRCPDLDLYPAIVRDATKQNWRKKRDMFSRCRLCVVTPSRWLMNLVRESILKEAPGFVIPNGVDLNVFKPGNKVLLRKQFGLPADAFIALFVGSRAKSNRYKDFATVDLAVRIMGGNQPKGALVFLSVGDEKEETFWYDGLQVRSYRFRNSRQDVVPFFQLADVFLHAANADNFPTTILEAMACGTPVIATGIGGIPEQIDHGRNGFLVPRGNARQMADIALHLMKNEALLREMSLTAVQDAKNKYDIKYQAAQYLARYEDLAKQRQGIAME